MADDSPTIKFDLLFDEAVIAIPLLMDGKKIKNKLEYPLKEFMASLLKDYADKVANENAKEFFAPKGLLTHDPI